MSKTMTFVCQYRQIATAIANLNNNAATEMEAGNYTDAYIYLSSALSATKRSLRLQRDDLVRVHEKDGQMQDLMETSCDDDHDHHHHQRKSGLQDPNLVFFHSQTWNMNASSCDGSEAASDCYLFHRPFELNVEAIEQSIVSLPSARVVTETLTVSVVYNLALAHHLHAAAVRSAPSNHDDDSSATELLHRALGLYNQTTRLLHAHPSLHKSIADCDCDGGDVLILFKIVISNNMGHAYYCLGGNGQHREHASRCFQDLAHALSMYCNGTTNGTTISINENRHQRNLPINDGFLSNIFLLCLTCNTAAAA